jgi:hypothetical protein
MSYDAAAAADDDDDDDDDYMTLGVTEFLDFVHRRIVEWWNSECMLMT